MSDGFDIALKGWAKPVWLSLVWRANEKPGCWPSLDRIATDVGCTVRTVCSALDELEHLGLIYRERSSGGRSQTTKYTLNCERASQLTVNVLHTKERERKSPYAERLSADARKDLDRARMVNRRSEVKATFEALCSMYPEGVTITVPMIAREMGSTRPSTVRSDMVALIKNLDLDLDLAVRFGQSKRKPWHAGRLKNVVPFRRERA